MAERDRHEAKHTRPLPFGNRPVGLGTFEEECAVCTRQDAGQDTKRKYTCIDTCKNMPNLVHFT